MGNLLLDLDIDFVGIEKSLRERDPNLEGDQFCQALNVELQRRIKEISLAVFDEFDKLHHGAKDKCTLVSTMKYLILGSKVRFKNEEKLGVDFDKLKDDILETKFAHMSGINESWLYVAPHFSFFVDHLEVSRFRLQQEGQKPPPINCFVCK